MKQKIRTLLFYFCVPLVMGSCEMDPELNDNESVAGYRPVYGSAEASEILFTQSRAVDNPGKIYVYGPYLLVNERRQGIHVFNNSNPAMPENIGFIQLLGNSDMAIKDGTLYADHLGNLVSLTINDFTAIQELGRLPLRNWNRGVPPPSRSHFECVDSEKGIVVGWKRTQLKNPQCYALQ